MNSTRSPEAPALTYITKNTEIKADLHCDIDIRIAGSVEGEVESTQKIILDNSGKVKGSIISAIAEIYGEVIGDIWVSDRLTLHPTAVIDGKISAKILIIEDGAQIKGSLKVGPETELKKKVSDKISSKESSKLSA
ncbi:MAG: polymer-forming cytoskeletal protein [Balneolaceae bacterium]